MSDNLVEKKLKELLSILLDGGVLAVDLNSLDELRTFIQRLLNTGQEPVGYLRKTDYSFISFAEAHREKPLGNLNTHWDAVFSSPPVQSKPKKVDWKKFKNAQREAINQIFDKLLKDHNLPDSQKEFAENILWHNFNELVQPSPVVDEVVGELERVNETCKTLLMNPTKEGLQQLNAFEIGSLSGRYDLTKLIIAKLGEK